MAIPLISQMAMIGSANMDRRSFELNYEMNMLFLDARLVGDLDDRQASYVARSESISIGEIRNWSIRRRLRNNLLALAAPIL